MLEWRLQRESSSVAKTLNALDFKVIADARSCHRVDVRWRQIVTVRRTRALARDVRRGALELLRATCAALSELAYAHGMHSGARVSRLRAQARRVLRSVPLQSW